MKNKKSILLINFLILSIISFAQDRVNRVKLNYNDTSLIVNKATGWSYNSTLGEWIDYENVICNMNTYKTNFKDLIGESMMSLYYQNFLSIQTKTLIIEGEKYYILYIKKYVGSYDYPHIRKDWKIYTSNDAFIFSQKEFQKLNNISNKTIELKSKLKASVYQKFYTPESFTSKIQDCVLSNIKHPFVYIFPIYKAENGKIRFLLPNDYPSYEKKYNMEEEYFEIDLQDFQKLIIDL